MILIVEPIPISGIGAMFSRSPNSYTATKDADVVIILGDVYNCLLGENTLKWVACDHAGLNASARDEVFAKGFAVTGAAGRSAPVLAEHCIYFMMQYCYHTKELLAAQEQGKWGVNSMCRSP